jgi:hypothetical protein
MTLLRAAALAGLLLAALPCAAQAGGQTIIVAAPPYARVTVALSGPAGGEVPPLLTVFVSPQPDYRTARRNRALFQRWTGFRKQYIGRRYPF